MASSSPFLAASMLLLLLPLLSSAARDQTKALTNLKTAFQNEMCGYEPIENLPGYFQILGEYATKEFNNQNGRSVEFHRTMSAAKFIHFGTSYDLQIMAVDGTGWRTFRAIVYKPQIGGHKVKYILNDFIAISRTEDYSSEEASS